MMKKGLNSVVVLVLISLSLVGCSFNNGQETKTNNASIADDRPGKKLDIKAVGGGEAPDDQGDLNVKIEAEVEENAKALRVTGQTNLMPGSKLEARVKDAEHQYLTYTKSIKVADDGTFDEQIYKPESTNQEIWVEMVFRPSNQEEAIKHQYGPAGEKLQGNLVYQSDKDKGKQREVKIFAHYTPIKDKQAKATFIQPQWDKPSDYGQPIVWIKPEVKKDGKFLYVTGKSNLLEGSTIEGRIEIPDHLIFGYSDHNQVNPDGSFYLTVRCPDEKDDLYLLLEFAPGENSWDSVKTAYGVLGEKLQGTLVKTYDNVEKQSAKKVELKFQLPK